MFDAKEILMLLLLLFISFNCLQVVFLLFKFIFILKFIYSQPSQSPSWA